MLMLMSRTHGVTLSIAAAAAAAAAGGIA